MQNALRLFVETKRQETATKTNAVYPAWTTQYKHNINTI